MFCDITWGAGGSTADLTLDIASKMQNMARHAVAPPSHRTRSRAPPDLRGDDDAPHVHQHAS